LAYKA